MTNRIALFLFLAILAAFAIDRVTHDGAGAVFLARHFANLVEYVVFWR